MSRYMTDEQWARFAAECVDTESSSNVVGTFAKLTKRHGPASNGGVPLGFFEKRVRDGR